METLRFIHSNFWIWLGSFLFLAFIIKAVLVITSNFFDHREIMKHGYPPEYYVDDNKEKKDD